MISEKYVAQSGLVAYLSFKEHEHIKRNVIAPKVNNFFKVRGIENFKEVSEGFEISPLDYTTKGISYFYDFILNDLHKKNGKFEFCVKYCLTLDKESCRPEPCGKTNTYYDEITLYKQPIFYFIYIDIAEIFSYLRKITIQTS